MTSYSRTTHAALIACAFLLTCTIVPAQSPSSDAEAREAAFRSAWSQADALHTAEDHAAAEIAYKALLAEHPASQRAALRIAIVQQRQGKLSDAVSSYDQAIAMDPRSEWGAVGLFYKARHCAQSGMPDEAKSAREEFRRLHPDSSYLARINLLEAEDAGSATIAAEEALAVELEAASKLEDALELVS